MKRFLVALGLGVLVLAASTIVSMAVGAMEIAPLDVVRALTGREVEESIRVVVREIRLPRMLTACIAGAALGLAGLIYQSLLKNALASEYTLGVSSGASLGAVLMALIGFVSPFAASTGAFAGAIGTMLVVSLLARANLSFETNSMVLAGIIFTSLASAALNVVLTIVSPNQLQSFFFWLMGSFALATWSSIAPIGVIVALLAAALMLFGWSMNAIAVDEAMAIQVGIAVQRTRVILYGIASLLTALVVSISGTIGFVGLVVPHFARLVVGVDNRKLIPFVAVSGAALCVLSDLLARTILAPSELPVGVVTAFVGVPVFVSLLRRRPS